MHADIQCAQKYNDRAKTKHRTRGLEVLAFERSRKTLTHLSAAAKRRVGVHGLGDGFSDLGDLSLGGGLGGHNSLAGGLSGLCDLDGMDGGIRRYDDGWGNKGVSVRVSFRL